MPQTAAQKCLALVKGNLRVELNTAIDNRFKQLGSDPRFDPHVAIRDITVDHLNDVRARKVREARQALAIKNNVDPRLAAAKGRGGVNPNFYAAESLLDRDPTERFNNHGLNATDAGRIFTSEIYRAAGAIMDKFRSRYWGEAIPHLLTPFADHNKGMDVAELVKAMKGKATTNAEMRELAAGLKKGSDVAIANYRKASGEIGKLDNFIPHDWVEGKFQGTDKAAWATEMLGNVPGTTTPILDRGLIKDVTTGKPLNEAQLRTALERSHDLISTDGRIRAEDDPGKYRAGRSMYRANDVSRFLAFTPEGYMHVMPKYMHDDIYSTMLGWFDSMARDTGTMHVLGPTPTLTARYVSDKLGAGSSNAAITTAHRWDDLYKSFRNLNPIDQVRSPRVAAAFSTARSIASVTKLGSAAIHSALIGDVTAATLRFAKNGIGPFGYLRDLTTALKNNQIDAGVLRDHQMIWDSRYYGMADHARTYGDLAYANHKIGNATRTMLDASGLEHLVQREQVAMQLNLTRRLTENAGSRFDQLPGSRQKLLAQYGVSPAQWDILRGATKDTPLTSGSFKGLDYDKLYGGGNAEHVTAARQFQHMLIGETGAAIFATPHILATAALNIGQRGTIGGEIARSLSQFGNWPMTAWHNMFGPLLGDSPLVSKAAYGAGLLVAGITSGFLGLQATQLLAGKAPLPVEDSRTWLSSLLRANLAGSWGDITARSLGIADPYSPRLGELASVFDLSPLLSTFAGIGYNTLYEPIHEGMKHHSIDEGLRTFGRTGLPELLQDFGSPYGLNLWQTKLAFERLVINNIERLSDPVGYLQRQQRINQRMRANGQGYLIPPP